MAKVRFAAYKYVGERSFFQQGIIAAMTFHLESPRLILRALTEKDIATFAAYRSDPAIAPYSLEQAARFVAEMSAAVPGTPGEWYQAAIEIQATGEMVGDIAFKLMERYDTRQAEIGITLASAYHGCGYATEAVECLLDYLFGQSGVHRVFANIDPRNNASSRVLERLNFRHEGRFIESLWFKGAWADEDWYAMLEQEWQTRPGKSK